MTIKDEQIKKLRRDIKDLEHEIVVLKRVIVDLNKQKVIDDYG